MTDETVRAVNQAINAEVERRAEELLTAMRGKDFTEVLKKTSEENYELLVTVSVLRIRLEKLRGALRRIHQEIAIRTDQQIHDLAKDAISADDRLAKGEK